MQGDQFLNAISNLYKICGAIPKLRTPTVTELSTEQTLSVIPKLMQQWIIRYS